MKLHWETIDRMRGWKRWPAENHLLMRGAFCPECDGRGTADGKIGQECEKCQGLGYFWHGGYRTTTCTACDGKGILGPWCPSCEGNAIGVFPGVQEVGCEIVQARYDRLIRRHLRDVEYAIVGAPAPAKNLPHAVAIRFDGGCGLLMPVDASRRADILT